MAVLPLYGDDDLCVRMRAGDVEAFNLIYRKYCRLCYHDAYKRLNDPLQCEELVQDVFTELWHTREYREIGNLKPYLQMAVKYSVFKLYQKQRSQPAFEEPLEHMILSENADAQLFAKELRGFIDNWLEAQPEKRREIFKMRYFQELSTKEISEELGVSQKTVQNTLLTAMTGLKGHLGKMAVLLPLVMDLKK